MWIRVLRRAPLKDTHAQSMSSDVMCFVAKNNAARKSSVVTLFMKEQFGCSGPLAGHGICGQCPKPRVSLLRWLRGRGQNRT